MTSAAQLKYLDAIGIPVWVSRDLVVKENKREDQSGVLKQQNPSVALRSTSTPTSANNTQTPAANSAQNIINALEQAQPNKANLNKVNLNEVVTETVNKTVIPDTLPDISHNSPTEINLVFKSAQHYIFASGNESADWMVIGHSPEDFNGVGHEPFAGEAGDLLVNMIRAVGIDYPRQDAFFVNVLGINRSQDTTTDIDAKCALNIELTRLINKINPKLVLIVGQIAAQNLLEVEDPLIIMRSKVHYLTENKLPCVVTYYPSYLVQKPIDKRKAWTDLKLAMSQISDVS